MSKHIQNLRARLAELKAEGKSILNAAKADGDRALTADEDQRATEIEASIESVERDLAAAEARDRRELAFEQDPAATGAADDNRATPGVTVGDDRSTLDPTCGFANLADFANCVRRASPGAPNMQVDPRLAAMYAAPTNFHREGGANEGYLVPPQMRDRIWELVIAGEGLVNLVDAEETNSNHINDLQDESTPWGGTGIQARWRSEGSQMSADRDEDLEPRSLPLHELYVFVQATEELLEDAPRLNSRLEGKSARAMNWKLDDSIIYGNGAGKPLGYFPSNALVTVAKDAGQLADTVSVDNLLNMYSRLLPDGLSRSLWLMNSDVVPKLGGLTIGDQPVWVPPREGLHAAPGGFLMGRPIRLTEHAKTVGDKGDIQFIDPMGYYAARKAGGVKFATSIHLFFDYNMMAFRWTLRFGGMPHLSKPVTPNNGSATKSHFVTLAERA